MDVYEEIEVLNGGLGLLVSLSTTAFPNPTSPLVKALLNPGATLGPVCEMSQAQKQSPASKAPEQEFRLYFQFLRNISEDPFLSPAAAPPGVSLF